VLSFDFDVLGVRVEFRTAGLFIQKIIMAGVPIFDFKHLL